ncbi:MAG: nucleoside triphosphate pyrophosphohydrolase [Actinobacteria bacterium]|nr:nucleoside triphosphate pyrophosphohydrolase [Actinomycetota bacterium]
MTPEEKSKKSSFSELVEVMKKLRLPNGCLWDREQTHQSIKRNMIEESYEAVEAIDEGDFDALKEELGDLLLQVVFHSQMAEEEGKFDIYDVIHGIVEKIKRRHPHIFNGIKVKSTGEIIRRWEKIKQGEKDNGKNSLNQIPKSLPSLHYALLIQQRVARFGFDWDDSKDILQKLNEELNEFTHEVEVDGEHTGNELGDLLFTLVNIARHLNVDPEDALNSTCKKFISRFNEMEELAKAKGRSLEDISLGEMDEIWNQVKSRKDTGKESK